MIFNVALMRRAHSSTQKDSPVDKTEEGVAHHLLILAMSADVIRKNLGFKGIGLDVYWAMVLFGNFTLAMGEDADEGDKTQALDTAERAHCERALADIYIPAQSDAVRVLIQQRAAAREEGRVDDVQFYRLYKAAKHVYIELTQRGNTSHATMQALADALEENSDETE